MTEYWTAFILGFAGSAHCAGMCGPLALALPAGTQRWEFLAGRAAYNLGRILTYAFLGTLFGAVGKTLVLAGVQRWVSIALGVCLLAGLASSKRLGLWGPLAASINWLKSRMGTLLRQRSARSLLVLGMLNGFLPCGLVYVACAGATATGSIGSGAQYMALFGLGTAPMLLAISYSGQFVPVRWRAHFRKAVPFSVFLLASMLILRGLGLGIPYFSPDPAAGHNCCPPN